jgi:glycosyltransferase involved in cell wall biosynthesis
MSERTESPQEQPGRALVSVVVPVYNAEAYVEQAVRSALELPQVLEVLLVEDASTDGSLGVCRRLAESRVRLLCHPGGRNLGAAASRNLGIEHAAGAYVAFLDADDYYLPNRFERDLPMMEADRTIEGVYGAVRTQFDPGCRPLDEEKREATTVSEPIEPDELLRALALGGRGSFHTDGITVRREVFAKVGGFDERLRQGQDRAMWLKMAAVCRLVPGSIDEPCAVRRRHAANRSYLGDPGWHGAGSAYMRSALDWARAQGLGREKLALLRRGLALGIVGRRQGTGRLGGLWRVLDHFVRHGLTYPPVWRDLLVLVVRKLRGRPLVSHAERFGGARRDGD